MSIIIRHRQPSLVCIGDAQHVAHLRMSVRVAEVLLGLDLELLGSAIAERRLEYDLSRTLVALAVLVDQHFP
jgi:hypothetical protein